MLEHDYKTEILLRTCTQVVKGVLFNFYVLVLVLVVFHH